MFVAYILVFISLGFIWAFWKMSCSFLFNMILLFLAWLWDHMRITCIVLAITMVLGVVFTVFSIGWRDQYHELFYEGSAIVRFLELTSEPHVLDWYSSGFESLFGKLFGADSGTDVFVQVIGIYLAAYLIPVILMLMIVLLMPMCFIKMLAAAIVLDLILKLFQRRRK